jgi:hypothetical protein
VRAVRRAACGLAGNRITAKQRRNPFHWPWRRPKDAMARHPANGDSRQQTQGKPCAGRPRGPSGRRAPVVGGLGHRLRSVTARDRGDADCRGRLPRIHDVRRGGCPDGARTVRRGPPEKRPGHLFGGRGSRSSLDPRYQGGEDQPCFSTERMVFPIDRSSMRAYITRRLPHRILPKMLCVGVHAPVQVAPWAGALFWSTSVPSDPSSEKTSAYTCLSRGTFVLDPHYYC